MKQIFDFMRRRVNENISTGRFGVGVFLDTINEAEAKWEADCKRADFEYRINDVLPMLEEKCLYGTASLIKAMADALGIKISEVE